MRSRVLLAPGEETRRRRCGKKQTRVTHTHARTHTTVHRARDRKAIGQGQFGLVFGKPEANGACLQRQCRGNVFRCVDASPRRLRSQDVYYYAPRTGTCV